MDNTNNIDWKELAHKMLIMLRVLFTVTVTWDFFLTVGFQSSQRALSLTGLSAVFSPFIIALWIFLSLRLVNFTKEIQ